MLHEANVGTDQAPSALDNLTVRSRSSNGSLHLKSKTSRPMRKSDDIQARSSQQATLGSTDSAFEMIPYASSFSVARREPKLPCHLIPFGRHREFYGRSETIQMIDDYFFQRAPDHDFADLCSTQLRTFALCGPGGIGKTQTAVEYASSRKEEFDAIFWVHADQAAKIADSFCRIATATGLVQEGSDDAKDQVVTRDTVKGWLANPLTSYLEHDKGRSQQASWLLVFDNVEDQEVLTDYWPLDGPGCVLVTSRDPLAKRNGFSAMYGTDLQPLSRADGAEVLLKLTGRGSEDEEKSMATKISEQLGGFPLAIHQMAGIITRRELTFAEFLATYEEESSREELYNLSLEHPSRRNGYEHTVASVWAMERLEDGAVLMDILSLFDPDGIQEDIFTTAPHNVPLDGFPKTLAAYQRARSELTRSSLVVRDGPSKKLVIHRLIQDTTRSKMSHERFILVFSVAVVLLYSVWPFDASDWQHNIARWAVCAGYFPHIVRLKGFASRFVQSSEDLRTQLQLSRLLSDGGWYVLFYPILENMSLK